MQKVRVLLLVTIFAGILTAFVAALAMMERNRPATEEPTSVNIDFVPDTPACALLTKSIATRYLGTGLQSSTANATTQTDDADVASCSYVSASKPAHSAILLMRKAKTAAGRETNQTLFTVGQKKGQALDSYDAPAYWDATMGQLNILRDGNWYMVVNGVSTPFNARVVSDAIDLARDMHL